MEQHTSQLRQSGLRVTPARQAILEVLTKTQRPLSVDRLWAAVKRHQIDRVTVYRTMETLSKSGLIRSIDLGHGHRDYELNAADDHHHHQICQNCGTIADVQVKGEEKIIDRLGQQHGFRPSSHSLEIFGLCAECQ